MDFVGFLSMIIHVVLYTQCLRYNICSAWFLDIRISICCSSDQSLLLFKFKIFVSNTSLFTLYKYSSTTVSMHGYGRSTDLLSHTYTSIWENIARVTGINYCPNYPPL